jgi:hypothetical protein
VTNFAYSRIPAFNPNTSPVSVARSATGSVYDIGDTGFTTPLNLTLVATNTVTTTLISDANAMFPDFTLVDRTQCVFKSGTQVFVLTTTTPIPGPTGAASTVPGPAGPATTDASLLAAGTVADARLPARLQDTALNDTYASYVNLAKNPDSITTGAVTVDGSDQVTSAVVLWPNGQPGALTITSRDANGAVLAYNITYGSPVTKTYTQPTITRNANGAATNVPQIVVS